MATILYERPLGSAKRGRRKIFFFPLFQVLERLRSYRWTIEKSFIAEQVDFINRMNGAEGIGATGLDGLRAVEVAASRNGNDEKFGDSCPEWAATRKPSQQSK